jgi:hypothetical protein
MMVQSYKLRVEIIRGLLGEEESCSIVCSECVDGVYSIAEISASKGGYHIDYIVRDSIEHLDQATVFFELLDDGWLFSGVRRVNELGGAHCEIPSCITLDDEGLDAVLQMAAQSREH